MPSKKSHFHFLSPRSFIKIIRPDPKPFVTFRNKLNFYGEELLAPRPTPKLEDHHLSAVRDCLFNIFTVTSLYLQAVASIRNLRTRHAVLIRDPHNMDVAVLRCKIPGALLSYSTSIL
jgi:hypothetical protein